MRKTTVGKGSLHFFLLRSAGKKAVKTSNSALKSSESKLFNAGSTIKIGHFLDDIMSSEIKVSNPEISEFLKILIFASTKFTFRKQINENELNHLENGSEVKPYQAFVTYFQ